MTIDDARNALWDWFESHDSFQLERDVSKLILIHDEGEEEKRACVRGALKDFAETALVKESVEEQTAYYILNKPIDMYEQTVSLNFVTAKQVALTVNNFCEAVGDKTDWVDRSNVQEKDIRSLIAIISLLEKGQN